MYKPTTESHLVHRGWLPGRHDNRYSFADLSAAYDTVNHRLLTQKRYNTTNDSLLCRVIQNMLSNRRFYVEMTNEKNKMENTEEWPTTRKCGCCCLPTPLLVGGVRSPRLWSTSQLFRPYGQQFRHSSGVCP